MRSVPPQTRSRKSLSPILERSGAPLWLIAAGTGTTAGVMVYLGLLAALDGAYGAVAAFGGVAAVVLGVAALLHWAHGDHPTWGDALVAGGPAAWTLVLAGGLGLVPLAAAKALAWAAHRAIPALAAAAAAVVFIAHTAGPVVAVAAGTLRVVPGDAAPVTTTGRTIDARGPPDYLAALESAGYDVQGHGAEIEAAPPGGSSHHLKINTIKGVGFDAATGRGFRLAALLRGAGVDLAPPSPESIAAAEARRKAAAAESERGAARWTTGHVAGCIYARGAIAYATTTVVAYLQSRGIPAPQAHAALAALPEGYRLHSIWGGGVYVSLFVARPDGRRSAAVLSLDGNGRKRPRPEWKGKARHTFGPRLPGAVIPIRPLPDIEPLGLPGHNGPILTVGEGWETTLAGLTLAGGPGAATVDCGHIRSLLDDTPLLGRALETGTAIRVLADREPSGAGAAAAEHLRAVGARVGVPVVVCTPPLGLGADLDIKADWLDVLAALGPAGARAALIRAQEAAAQEAAAEAQDDGTVRRMPGLSLGGPVPPRPWAPAPPPDDVRPAIDAALTSSTPTLLRVPPGTGKTAAIAAAMADLPDPTVYVCRTTVERDIVAALMRGVPVPARTPINCERFHELIEPLAEQRRSEAAHACATCVFGAAAMVGVAERHDAGLTVPTRPDAEVWGETREIEGEDGHLAQVHMCSYIWNIMASRDAEHTAATEAKVAGDPTAAQRRECGGGGYGRLTPRRRAWDDVSALTAQETATIPDGYTWLRVGGEQITRDRRAADQPLAGAELASAATRAEAAASRKARAARADATERLLPILRQGMEVVVQTAQDRESHVRLQGHPWDALAAAALNPDMTLMDATAAEAVVRHDDGEWDIPLRALQSLSRAIRHGTAWATRGVMIWRTWTPLAEALLAGEPVTILDATPGGVRDLVAAVGGTVGAMDPLGPNVRVIQHWAGVHGKTACDPASPSYARERARFLAALGDLAGDGSGPGSGPLAVISHMAFVQAIFGSLREWDEQTVKEEGYHFLPSDPDNPRPGREVYVGWWGRHGRSHNAWLSCTEMAQWGVVTRSPREAMRDYMGDMSTLAAASGADPATLPEPSIARVPRTYGVPGCPGAEIVWDGYADEGLDRADQEWTAAETVQAIGRLRACRRSSEHLTVHIWAARPLAAAHGLRIDEIDTTAPWRQAAEYHADRADRARTVAAVGAAAIADAGLRVTEAALAAWCRDRGIPGLRHGTLGRILRDLPPLPPAAEVVAAVAALYPRRQAQAGEAVQPWAVRIIEALLVTGLATRAAAADPGAGPPQTG